MMFQAITEITAIKFADDRSDKNIVSIGSQVKSVEELVLLRDRSIMNSFLNNVNWL